MEDFKRRGDSFFCALEPLEAVLISRTLIDTAERTVLVTGIPVPQVEEFEPAWPLTGDSAAQHSDPFQELAFTSAGPATRISDPAVALILPDGVPTSPVDSADFRELTQGHLATTKVRRLLNWGGVIARADGEFEVEGARVLDFVAALNDARLLLHSRLVTMAVAQDDVSPGPHDLPLLEAMYEVLTWMAGAVLEAAGSAGPVTEDLDSIS